MSSPPLPVTVVIPTRNRGGLIAEGLRTLMSLKYRATEILIIDQSTDDLTRRAVLEIAGNDPLVRLESSTTVGLAISRNIGARLSRGDLVAYTDDDCIVAPGWLEAIVAEFREPDVAAVWGRMLPYEWAAAGADRKRTGIEADFHPSTARAEYSRPVPPWYVGHGGNMAFRRTVLLELGAFDPVLGAGGPLSGADDTDIIYRMLSAGKKLVYAPNALIYHRDQRDWPARRKAERAYGIGIGAMMAKYVRGGDLQAAGLFSRWIWELGVRRVGAGLLKWRSRKVISLGWCQLVYPWLGAWKSLRYRIASERPIYVQPPLTG